MFSRYIDKFDFKSRFRILKGGKISLVVSAFLTTATLLNAAPIGGNVTSGSANISQSGNTTNINQSTNKASINWQNFSIGTNETVNFNQPNANSITLNRVIGTSNSLIQGAMNANGQVILVNPNGVVFSEGSTVNVGGLVGTTKNITDQDFQNGNYKFEGNSNASILNKGTIKAKNGGYVALVADQVVNEGRIEATLGRVELSSGNKFTINLNNDSLVKLTIDEGTLNGLVENKGIIKADGGKIYLTTQAVDSILDGVVNNTGIIEAQSLSSNENGEIVLFAHGGTAEIGGEIKAEGGFVETSGKEFAIKPNATIKAKNWLIDPVNITIDSTLAGTISTALGSGNVIIETTAYSTPSASSVDTTASESGTDGDILVNANITKTSGSDATLTLKAHRDIILAQDVSISSSSNKLNVYLSANNAAADVGTITLNSGSSIITNGGNIIIGGVLNSNGVPTVSNVNGVNFLMQGATLNARSGNITIGADSISLEGINPDVGDPIYSSVIGHDILINTFNHSLNIDGTNFESSNSLTLRVSGDATHVESGSWDEWSTFYDQDGNPLYDQDGNPLGEWITHTYTNDFNNDINFNGSNDLQSSITFTGGNILTLDSANQIKLIYNNPITEEDGAIPITFSDEANVTIKVLQGYGSVGYEDLDIDNEYDNIRAQLIGNVDSATIWESDLFETSTFYDIKGGTVNTTIFSDGTTENGFASGPYTPKILNNGLLAFGNGFNDSINEYGMLRQPHYWDTSMEQWNKLSYANYALAAIIGMGGDGTNEWNNNGSFVTTIPYSQVQNVYDDNGNVVGQSGFDYVDGAFSPVVIDYTNLENGIGSIIATNVVTIDGKTIEMKNIYTLNANQGMIAMDTSLKNTSGSALNNLRLWVGTQDDWIGISDETTKTRGNLINGSFVAIEDATDRSKALMITGDTSGVLFRTTSNTSNVFFKARYGTDFYTQDPATSGPLSLTNRDANGDEMFDDNGIAIFVPGSTDGAYGVFTRYSDLSNGENQTVKWYYGAGSLADLADIAETVSVQPGSVEDNSSTPIIVTPVVEQKIQLNDIVTNIVNNSVKNNIPVTSIIQPKTDVKNGFERTVPSSIVNNNPEIGNNKSLGNTVLGLNDVIRSANPSVNTISKDTKLTVVGETGGEGQIAVVELQDLIARSGGGELRVALSPDSFVELVNGGVNLPSGVSQEFYIVEDKK